LVGLQNNYNIDYYKLINYLISGLIILLFLGHNFWTQNPRKSIKSTKTQILA